MAGAHAAAQRQKTLPPARLGPAGSPSPRALRPRTQARPPPAQTCWAPHPSPWCPLLAALGELLPLGLFLPRPAIAIAGVRTGGRNSCGWGRGSGEGLPSAPLPAKDHVLVNFNFHTVEKHTVQATWGIHCTTKATDAPQNTRAPLPPTPRHLPLHAERHRGGGTSSVLGTPTPVKGLPLPAVPRPPPGGQAAFQRVSGALCPWPVSLLPQGLAGKPGRLRSAPAVGRVPTLDSPSQTRPPPRASRLVGSQPWSFSAVGTVVFSGGGEGGGWEAFLAEDGLGDRPEQVSRRGGRGRSRLDVWTQVWTGVEAGV